MSFKLSIFTTITDPEKRGDTFRPALNCYRDLADELVIIDGSKYVGKGFDLGYEKLIVSKWPKEFEWTFIGEQFQRGYEESIGDWVIHCDIDFLFHERDFGKIRQALKDYPTAPAVSFYKWQFILPDRYNLKSRLLIAVNKAAFGNRIKFNGGGDLCQPTLDGKDLNIDEMPQAGVPFYNYEKLTKNIDQIIDDVGRMDRAYQKHFGTWLYSEDGTSESAYDGWLEMMVGRAQKPSEHIPLEKHPKYIQKTIDNLTPDMWGYSGFSHIGETDYVKSRMRG